MVRCHNGNYGLSYSTRRGMPFDNRPSPDKLQQIVKKKLKKIKKGTCDT